MESYCIEKNSLTAKQRRILSAIAFAFIITMTLISFTLMLIGYSGMNIVFCISLVLSAAITTHIILRSLQTSARYAKVAKILQRCFVICILVSICGFLTLQGLILSGSFTEEAEVDCIIVLGAGIFGETPSRILVSRLDSALEYARTRNVPIIVSGGQGPGESITEAEAMYRYLKSSGVDETLIYKEGESTSTWENLAYSYLVMEDMGIDTENAKIAIVTNEFHLFRAKHIAWTMGLDAIGVAAQTPYPSLRVLYHFREAAAILNSFLFCRA